MRRKHDPLTRARQALRQVDPELDLGRTRSNALERARTSPETAPESDDTAGSSVEILRHGQRPALPRRRTAVWALVATVALLGGAGLGTAVLWTGPGETVPGAPAPASPSPALPTPGPGSTTSTPSTGPPLDPRECEPAANALAATPEPGPSGQPSSAQQPESDCTAAPSATPSARPTAGPDGAGE